MIFKFVLGYLEQSSPLPSDIAPTVMETTSADHSESEPPPFSRASDSNITSDDKTMTNEKKSDDTGQATVKSENEVFKAC